MRKKGEIPISYIVALLLGIAVVAILLYWFFVLGGTVGGQVSAAQCRTMASTWCSGWQLRGYDFTCNPATCQNAVPGVGWFDYPTGRCVVADKTALGLYLAPAPYVPTSADATAFKTACTQIQAGTR